MTPANPQQQDEKPVIENTPEVLEMVRLCGEGDRPALKAFFERFSEDIYNFPLKVFHLDQDAASDFYLYAFERLKDGGRFRSFQGRSTFRTWFYTVLRNLVIDWMRTIREVDTVNVTRTDDKGNEFRLIENTPDPRSLNSEDHNLIFGFKNQLTELPVDLRLIFKLSYVYYLDLTPEEMEYLSEKSGKSQGELLRLLADLKHRLSEKELKNLGSEDKITSLYLAILELKVKREKLLSTAAQPGGEPPDPAEMIRIERAIEKKYQQREKLLVKKSRGHFIVRTPYKHIATLLQIPEGSVSVQMMRVLERIRSMSGST
ncbi:MAG: RNA polymerase sigma factor [bacterium]|nr:RNA polymerase sigma factor [bacterium]